MTDRIKLTPDVVVRHKCDNTRCVKPDHLELGTQLDNIQDRDNRNRTQKGQKHVSSKLTPNQVREIREEYSILPNYNALSRRYGVSAASIRKIILGQNWSHIK